MKVIMVDSLVDNDYSLCLCQGLAKNEIDVVLVLPEGRSVDERYAIPVHFLGPSKGGAASWIIKTFKYFGYLWALFRLPRKQGADVIHFQFFRRDRIESLLFPLMRLTGARLIHTAHNILPHENLGIDYLLKFLVYKSAHKIVVHSEYIRKKLLDTFTLDREKVAVIPHGNFDLYLPKTRLSKKQARNHIGLAETGSVLLFFGAIRAYKGVDLLLDAFDIISDDLSDLTLVVVGNPFPADLARSLKDRINNIKNKERVVFVPEFIPTEEVHTYFDAAEAVVLPYKHIDHSGIVHLAYSFGKPIIATDVGDFRETIENDKSGFIAAPNSAFSLAESIRTAFENPDCLVEIAKLMEELNQTKYAWKGIGGQTADLYRKSL